MHSAVLLDHILTYTNAPSIDQRLDAYRAAGFQVAEQTARHGGGLRNVFVAFGPEYLEVVWVEDEVAFSQEHPYIPKLTRQDARAAKRPFALGLVSPNVNHLHDAYHLGEIRTGLCRIKCNRARRDSSLVAGERLC